MKPTQQHKLIAMIVEQSKKNNPTMTVAQASKIYHAFKNLGKGK